MVLNWIFVGSVLDPRDLFLRRIPGDEIIKKRNVQSVEECEV